MTDHNVTILPWQQHPVESRIWAWIEASEDDLQFLRRETVFFPFFFFLSLSFSRPRKRAFTATMRGTILVFVALLVVVCATEVNHCGTGK